MYRVKELPMAAFGAARDNKNNKINNVDVPPDTTVDGIKKNISKYLPVITTSSRIMAH
jgi:hypothetical protein